MNDSLPELTPEIYQTIKSVIDSKDWLHGGGKLDNWHCTHCRYTADYNYCIDELEIYHDEDCPIYELMLWMGYPSQQKKPCPICQTLVCRNLDGWAGTLEEYVRAYSRTYDYSTFDPTPFDLMDKYRVFGLCTACYAKNQIEIIKPGDKQVKENNEKAYQEFVKSGQKDARERLAKKAIAEIKPFTRLPFIPNVEANNDG